MKYQDFSIDENFVSSEDTIFVFHMWRYQLMKFMKFICLIAIIFRIHINATFFSIFRQNPNVRKIYILLDWFSE